MASLLSSSMSLRDRSRDSEHVVDKPPGKFTEFSRGEMAFRVFRDYFCRSLLLNIFKVYCTLLESLSFKMPIKFIIGMSVGRFQFI